MGTLESFCKQPYISRLERNPSKKEHLPRIDTSDLGRSFVSPAVLALLVCLGKDLEQLLTNSHGLALVADHFPTLINAVSYSSAHRSDERSVLASVVPMPTL